MSKLTRTVAAVGLAALPLVGCAAHATSSPPVLHGSAQQSSSSPVASVLTSPPPASQAPCPSDSGWTGANLSTAPPDPAAWLTSDQLPDAAVYHWTAQGGRAAMPFVQDMWNVLYDVGIGDFLAWQLQNYEGSVNGQFASQTVLLYASEARAYCAYQGAVAAAAGNQAVSRSTQVQYRMSPDAVTTEIVSGEHDSVWSESWTGPSIPPVAHGPQTDVEYMVQVGTAVTFVGFVVPGLDQSIPDAAAAQATLIAITQHLSVYASGS
jgi:hypothetical protein